MNNRSIFKLKFLYSIASLLLIFLFNSCSSSNKKTTTVIQDITESVYASGVIKAANQYEVFATTNGILKDVLVKEGDTIDIDTPLFIIDNKISAISSENARLTMELSKDKTGPASNTLRELEARLSLAKKKPTMIQFCWYDNKICGHNRLGQKLIWNVAS